MFVRPSDWIPALLISELGFERRSVRSPFPARAGSGPPSSALVTTRIPPRPAKPRRAPSRRTNRRTSPGCVSRCSRPRAPPPALHDGDVRVATGWRASPALLADAVEAIRGSGAYPALTTALERAGVTSLETYAAATRRAAAISVIADEGRACRAQAQYQGALALVTHAGARGGLAAAKVTEFVSSLSAIPLRRARRLRRTRGLLVEREASASAAALSAGHEPPTIRLDPPKKVIRTRRRPA